MENAAEALKIAGFTLLFVTALAIAMSTVMQGKEVSETVLRGADKTKYYSDIQVDSRKFDKNGNRILTIDKIIPTLYRYKQEEYIVLFYNSNDTYLQILDDTKPRTKLLSTKSEYFGKKISYLNYYLEDKMQEPWRENDRTIKEHVDNVVTYLYKNYNNNKFSEKIEKVKKYKNKYNNNAGIIENDQDVSDESEQTKDAEIRIITYTKQ